LSDYSNPVNIGNPNEISLKDFAEEVLKLTESNVQIVYRPLPTDDPKQRKPDISKAKEILNWEPRIERAEGLKKTYQYFKSLPESDWFAKPKEF
jgi:dTDP-glucose 4,6-dehydratase